MVKKSLLIGINYTGTPDALSGCVNDSNNIKDFLLTSAGFSSDQIVLLTDDTQLKPTKENMEKAMISLVKNATRGDILFLQVSCHGSSIIDRNGDERDGRDEVFVPLDFKTRGVITDDWLFANVISKIPEGVFLFCLFDLCHSGSISDLPFAWNYTGVCEGKPNVYNSSEWPNRFSFVVESKHQCKGNVIVFSGCQDTQTSADVSSGGKSFGAFTSTFIEFLNSNLIKYSNGATVFNNAKIKYRDVLKEINARLIMKGYSQRSVLSSSLSDNLEKTISF